MTTSEFSNEFDILYNNVMSNQAPGLDEYEKSVFLTKAHNEILLSYFNPKLNKVQEGFDGSEKRQIDFSNLIKVIAPIRSTDSTNITPLHLAENTAFYEVPDDLLLYINEFVDVFRDARIKRLNVVPLQYTEYNRLMSKPFTRPLKNQAWRLFIEGDITGIDHKSIALLLSVVPGATVTDTEFYEAIANKNIKVVSSTGKSYLGYVYAESSFILKNDATFEVFSEDLNLKDCLDISSIKGKIETLISSKMPKAVQLVPGPTDDISKYVVRYLKRPSAIVLENLEGGVSVEGISTKQGCILDPILHPEILQRAVELAKAAYVGDLSTMISVGNASATEKGIVSASKN